MRCECGAVLAVSAERAGTVVGCPNCARKLKVPATATAAPPPPATAGGWYVARNKKKTGPYTTAQLRQMAADGELAPGDMVLREGQTQWTKASTVHGLFPEAAATPHAPPPPPPPPRAASRQAGPPWLLIGVAAGVLLVLGIGGGFLLALKFAGRPSPPPPADYANTPWPPVEKEKAVPVVTPEKEKATPTPLEKEKAAPPEEKGRTETSTPPSPPEKTPSSPAAGRRPIDVKYIPAEAGAALVLHPRQILQSPLVKAALPPTATEAGKAFGAPPEMIEKVEQMIVLLHPSAGLLPKAPAPPSDPWPLVDSTAGRFSVRFPVKPKESERKTLLGTRRVFAAELDDGKVLYEVVYVDFSKDSPIVGDQSRVDFGTRMHQLKVGFKSKKDLKLGRYLGAEVVIDDTQLKTHSVHRVYVAGDRLYELQATARGTGKPPADADKFFDSFHLPGSEPSSPAELVPPDQIPLPAMIVRFGVPFDARGMGILKVPLGGEATPAKHGDREYLVGAAKDGLLGLPTAACQVDDRTVLVAPEPVLKKMIDAAGGTGPLLNRLAAADGNDDVTMLVTVPPYRPALNTLIKPLGLALPPAFASLATLPDQLAGLRFTVNLRGRTVAQLAVDAEDESAAGSVEKLVQAGVGLLRESAPGWEPLLASPALPKPIQKDVRALVDQLLGGPDVRRTGKQVVVNLSKPIRKGPLPVVADFKPYLPARAKEEVDLGGEAADAVVGGGGRFLIYHLKAAKKLVVFDVQQGKVVKQLPVLEEPMLFAAGARQLAVVYPAQKMLTLWGLESLEKEKTAPLPPPIAGSEIGHLCMGSASAGPVYCYLPATKHTVALDLGKMTARSVNWGHWSPTNAYGPLSMRVSADGNTLVGRNGGWAGMEMARFKDGKQIEGSDKFAFSMGVFANPSVDGRLMLYPDGVASVAGAEVQPAKGPPGTLIPARQPGIFLALQGDSVRPDQAINPNPRMPKVDKVALYSDNRAELLTLTDLDELTAGSPIAWDKIVHYYPRGGLLVTLAENRKVVLRKVDLTERLAKADLDYLFVLPQPAVGKPGETFRHRLDIRTRRGKAQVKVAFGPDGLTVTPEGEVVWPIPADFADAEATAMLSVTDATGQEIAHPLRITVSDE
ncbi:MAG: GYF domain-containing protein [Gemmataceae bacterium]